MYYHQESSFWRKVDVRASRDECWDWLGRTQSGKRSLPYGRLDFQCNKGVYAHRVAFFLRNPGKIRLRRRKRGKFVLHRCDNPKCCNPHHLYLGDHAQNMRDVRDRHRCAKTSTESPRAKLSSEDVFWLRLQKRHGATKKALALLYGVSEATISGACYGRHYQDVI